MGLILKCDFCGKMSEDQKDFFETTTRPFNSNEPTKAYIMCQDCIDNRLGKNAVVANKQTENKESLLDYEPEPEESNEFKPFIGMKLRKFLRCDMYKESLENFIFKDIANNEIGDITPYMQSSIAYMEHSCNDEDIIVTIGSPTGLTDIESDDEYDIDESLI